MQRKRFLVLALGAIGVALAAGCAPTARTNVYVHPTFQPGSLSTIAVLPIRNARFAPAQAQEINRKITQEMQRRNPDLTIVPATDAVDRMNAAGLVEAYSDFLRDLGTSGIPNADTLADVGEALEAEAIFQGEMLEVTQQDRILFQADGQTTVLVRFTLLSTRNGDILWEGIAEGRAMAGPLATAAPPLFEALKVAVDRLLGEFPPF